MFNITDAEEITMSIWEYLGNLYAPICNGLLEEP